MTRTLIASALLLLVGGQSAFGQTGGKDERGIPFPSEHHAPQEYQQDPQNWDIVQDERGLIYVANNNGVLQYDGERWRLIPTTTGTFVRSLAVDSLVYVGAKGDFGYLRPDSLGVLRYKSLYEHVPKDKREFEDVWATHTTSEGTYYQSNAHLFRWDGSSMKVWTSEEGFHTSFTVNGQLYVRDSGRGLLRMESDSLRMVPGGRTFHETPIYMMAQHPSGDLLIGTQNRGLLLYDGESFRPFASDLTTYLQENDLYHGARLSGNRYALATLGGGVVMIDAQGRVVRVFDRSSGLPDGVVNSVYPDREGQLWMALNSGGLFRVDVNTPLTLHNEQTGLEGAVHDVYHPHDTTYVATLSGLYVLREREKQVLGERSPYFERWGDLPLVQDMLFFGGDLLAATQQEGVYLLRGREKKPIADWVFTYDLESPSGTPVVYAGTRSGLKGLARNEGTWTSFSVDGVQGEIRSVVLEEESVLWVSTINGDISRVVLASDGRRVKEMTRFDEKMGLPGGFKVIVTVNDRITILAKQGLYQPKNTDQSPESWQFVRRSSLMPNVGRKDTLKVKSLQEGPEHFWMVLGDRVFAGQPQGTGAFAWEEIDPLHFPKSKKTSLSVDQNGTVWLGDGKRLFRYAPGERRELERPDVDFAARVRQVTILRRERVVYGGSRSGLEDDSVLTIPYGRDLRIDVAAPLYGTAEFHRYRYKLGGRSDEWSGWTDEASQRYRNLWEGTYHFRAQAKNDRGVRSTMATLTLRVQPPWYRSLWAYLFYGIAFVATAYGYRRYYQIKEENRRARQRVQELERDRVVAERLKRANERLREANRLKEDFLATTSHELRTPLTNILGSLEVLQEMATDEQERFLDMMEKNGERLKRTLNALLDLSMLRSGEAEMDRSPVPIDDCVREVASEHRTDAEEKELDFRVGTPDASVYADVDEQYVKQILRNLIENAIKFTEEGSVAVSAGRTDGTVYVEVKDTGIGIDEEFLPDLFAEFKQESRGRSRTYEGNGLGLALSARLAERMDGSISVETEKHEGSTFTVTFPHADAVGEAGTDEA